MLIASNSSISLRTWELTDAERAFEFYGDPRVSKFIGQGLPAASVDEVQKILLKFMELQREFGYSPWAVTESASERLLGICGIHNFNDVREPELGFRISYDNWGKGIATQASILATNYSFSDLKLASIAAITLTENTATQRVLEKAGFLRIETTDAACTERVLLRYELQNSICACASVPN